MSTMAPVPAIKPRRRILVMRYRFIGDTLLTVPFLRNLRAAYPEAEIHMLVAPNSGEVLRDCPYIDELILFDTTRKHRYENRDDQPEKQGFWHYVRLLRQNRYDTAFVLKRSFSSAALAFLAGIPERIGFDTEGRGWLLTKRVPYRQGVHEVDCFLDVLHAVEIPVTDRQLEAWWQPQESERVATLVPEGRNIVLHLSSSNPAKQWTDEAARELAEALLADPAVHLHGLGAASDAPIYEQLKRQLPELLQARLHIHCGQLDLLESMAFLQRMELVVGVDSGTLHMAAAVGTAVIALFGPMDELKWAPLGGTVISAPVACRPCNLDHPCRFDFECMRSLSAQTVLEQVRAPG